jgi:hypothetical protein
LWTLLALTFVRNRGRLWRSLAPVHTAAAMTSSDGWPALLLQGNSLLNGLRSGPDVRQFYFQASRFRRITLVFGA